MINKLDSTSLFFLTELAQFIFSFFLFSVEEKEKVKDKLQEVQLK